MPLRSLAAIAVDPGVGPKPISKSAGFLTTQPWMTWGANWFARPARLRAAAATMSRSALLLLMALGSAASAEPVDDARAAVVKKLKDPESARFTDVRVNGEAVCGLVNAKNAMGGYPGAHKFYYVLVARQAFIEGGGDISTDFLDQMAQGYSNFCH